MENIIYLRNNFIKFVYKKILKSIFFKLDPELVHDRMTFLGSKLGKNIFTRRMTELAFEYSNPILEQRILDINFPNPIGLSAGFDKNAVLTDILPSVGFGFMELGSITGEPCEGNPKPRLWRLKKSGSLAVYYGLKNDGCENISNKLSDKKFRIPVGINIAKTNSEETVETEKAIDDYFKAYKAFKNIGDYFTINISCPNAFGGQPFTDSERLDLLFQKIMSIPKNKPIFLKLSPDLSKEEIDQIISIAEKYKIDGFICSNLTKNRNNKKIIDKDLPAVGGLSGKIVSDLSIQLIRYIYKKTQGKFVIIGVGGISSGKDAYERIKAGASLLELITGMIFEGPQVISQINLELAKLLKKDGYKNISEAIGKEAVDKSTDVQRR